MQAEACNFINKGTRRRSSVNTSKYQVNTTWVQSKFQATKKEVAVEALEAVAVLIIIPLSGWEKVKADKGKKPEPVTWSRLLRNSTGILRNVSSEGMETRTKIRSIEGLVDSLVWIVRAAIAGDNRDDINNKVWLAFFTICFYITKLLNC